MYHVDELLFGCFFFRWYMWIVDDWLGRGNYSRATRNHMTGFSNEQKFKNIKQNYGISCGSLKPYNYKHINIHGWALAIIVYCVHGVCVCVCLCGSRPIRPFGIIIIIFIFLVRNSFSTICWLRYYVQAKQIIIIRGKKIERNMMKCGYVHLNFKMKWNPKCP